MILLLYGPDTYRARQKLNEIVERQKKIRKSGLNLRYFDLAEDKPEEVIDWLKQSPMFKERKLTVLENALKSIVLFKDFAKSKEHTLLFFEQGGSLPRVKYIEAQKFDFLEGAALRKWIKDEFAKYGVKIIPQALEKLIAFSGNDSWRLVNEIKKLASYCKGRYVAVNDVELLVRPKIETDIFKTVRALAFGDKKQALVLLRKHLEKGDNPLYLLSMISWQFRVMICGQRRSLFSQQELKKIYRKILAADINIKTGKMEPETTLDLLISEI